MHLSEVAMSEPQPHCTDFMLFTELVGSIIYADLYGSNQINIIDPYADL